MKTNTYNKYAQRIRDYAAAHYTKMLREPNGILKHKFIVPGSCYQNELWDWDSWLTNIALRKLPCAENLSEYEKGCVLNFLEHTPESGAMPITISPVRCGFDFVKKEETNIHKPVLVQHAVFASENAGDCEWLRPHVETVEKFLAFYTERCRHESGLYFWIDDCAIGVDNDPCTYYRPPKSSASIFLNCLLYAEFEAAEKLFEKLSLPEKALYYKSKADELRSAVQRECWDERDGFFYSADLNLLPVDLSQTLHSGAPRHWDCLVQRIGVWSGFLAMWSGIATREQAKRMVREHYANEKTFYAPYGVRTLSKAEKMYAVQKTCNPSCWLGPVWGVSNYMTYKGLLRYGYYDEATELAAKTIEMFGKDIESCGELHEYYHPETGEGVNNRGFQNWNLTALCMIDDLEKQAKE